MSYNVSVIIPFFNSQSTIVRCLASVFNQTYSPFEIILINDGSSDDSLNLVQNFFKFNSTIPFTVIDKTNGGVSSARNAGLKIAQGNIIALLDSDDEWVENKLEIQLQYFSENNNCDFLGGLIFCDEKHQDKISKITLVDLIFKNHFQPSTVIFKKQVLDRVGYFNECQKFAEEGNYFIRIASKYNCYLIHKQLVIYDNGRRGFGVSGLSSNIFEMEKGEINNIFYAKKNGLISTHIFIFALLYSVLKFIRRLIIVKFEKYV